MCVMHISYICSTEKIMGARAYRAGNVVPPMFISDHLKILRIHVSLLKNKNKKV